MRYVNGFFCSVLIVISPFVKGQEPLSCNPTADEADFSLAFESQNILDSNIHILTGGGDYCLGNTVMIPANVDNFSDVATFQLKYSYNKDSLVCEGLTNVHPQLLDSLKGWDDSTAGMIILEWNSPTPVTFFRPETVAELVFTVKYPGQGNISWITGATESYFLDSEGNPIPAEFQNGEVNIYEPPHILLDQSRTVCIGQFVSIMSIAVGNQPPLTYRWIYPSGDTTSNDPVFFSVNPADAGLYTLLVTDQVGCTDQKSLELIVHNNPVTAFHGIDTLEMHTGGLLHAGSGLGSYLWNTGETTESITINAEGMYVVEMESLWGCLGSDSVYIKLTYEEISESNVPAILIFPNPTNDILTIQFKEKKEDAGLVIYDIRGMKMVSQQIQQESTAIDIGNLIPGIYFIELTNNHYRMIRKLVVY